MQEVSRSPTDASAEFVYEIGKILDDNGVIWQTSELGKVDQGGGGTIAQYVANLNMDVIDCGVPVLSMHAPFEVTAKSDVYMAYKSYVAFIITDSRNEPVDILSTGSFLLLLLRKVVGWVYQNSVF